MIYEVKANAPFHAGRLGYLEFIGGPDKTTAVLKDLDDPKTFFAVSKENISKVPVIEEEIMRDHVLDEKDKRKQ